MRPAWHRPTFTPDGRRRLRSDGHPMHPSPLARRSACVWCGTPLWWCFAVTLDQRWFDTRSRTGPCTGDSPTGDHESGESGA